MRVACRGLRDGAALRRGQCSKRRDLDGQPVRFSSCPPCTGNLTVDDQGMLAFLLSCFLPDPPEITESGQTGAIPRVNSQARPRALEPVHPSARRTANIEGPHTDVLEYDRRSRHCRSIAVLDDRRSRGGRRRPYGSGAVASATHDSRSLFIWSVLGDLRVFASRNGSLEKNSAP
jgi:hypothetical protein